MNRFNSLRSSIRLLSERLPPDMSDEQRDAIRNLYVYIEKLTSMIEDQESLQHNSLFLACLPPGENAAYWDASRMYIEETFFLAVKMASTFLDLIKNVPEV